MALLKLGRVEVNFGCDVYTPQLFVCTLRVDKLLKAVGHQGKVPQFIGTAYTRDGSRYNAAAVSVSYL